MNLSGKARAKKMLNRIEIRSPRKGSTLALKPRADVTRSPKQGYQWQKSLVNLPGSIVRSGINIGAKQPKFTFSLIIIKEA